MNKKKSRKKKNIYAQWQIKLKLLLTTDLADFGYNFKAYNKFIEEESGRLYYKQFTRAY